MIVFNRWRDYWPLFFALLFLTVACGVCLFLACRRNDGHLVYALDDAYIHMASAKNLYKHGVFGVTQYGFSWACSSLIWPVLLWFCYVLFGVYDWIPLALNVAAASGLLILVHWMFVAKIGLKPIPVFCLEILLLLLTPLVPLIFTGLEHTLHALVSVALFWCVSGMLTKDRYSRIDVVVLFLLISLAILVRYEAVFLIFVVTVMFLARRRFVEAATAIFGGLWPLCIGGMIAKAHGWPFFPPSILLKGEVTSESVLRRVLYLLDFHWIPNWPHIFFLYCVACLLLYQAAREKGIKGFWDNRVAVASFIFINISILHMQFAMRNSFYRYEAYLVCMGIFLCGMGWSMYGSAAVHWLKESRRIRRYAICGVIGVLFFYSFAYRVQAITFVPRATNNIYSQQFQMGRFINTFHRGECVALNDVGAINYYTDIRCLDLCGLATAEVARHRLEGEYNAWDVAQMARSYGASIAVIYTSWFEVPGEWIEAGVWRIRGNWVCNRPDVHFYAIDPTKLESLIADLRDFSKYLPNSVEQSGLYCTAQ